MTDSTYVREWGMSTGNVLINCTHLMNEVAIQLENQGMNDRALRLLAIRANLLTFITNQ